MKSFIFLFLSLLFFENVKNSTYSINTFITYLQTKGYYDILAQIKKSFGFEVSIAFCKEFFQSTHCEEVVKVYINFYPYTYSTAKLPPNYSIKVGAQENQINLMAQNPSSSPSPEEIQEVLPPMGKYNEDFWKFIHRKEILDILKQEFREDEIDKKVEKVSKTVKFQNYVPIEKII